MTTSAKAEKPVSFREAYRAAPLFTALAAIAFINWFVFAGISTHFGGDSLGMLPSKDGFVVTSHGHRTPVVESVWVFSLLYPYGTLMLTPAIFFLYGAHQKILGNTTRAMRWCAVIFICIWVAFWYSSITASFIKSLRDYRSYRSPNPALESTAGRRVESP